MILPGHWLGVASSPRLEPRAWHPGIKNPILALPADQPWQPWNMPEGTFPVAGAVWKAQPGQGVRSPGLPAQVLLSGNPASTGSFRSGMPGGQITTPALADMTKSPLGGGRQNRNRAAHRLPPRCQKEGAMVSSSRRPCQAHPQEPLPNPRPRTR